MTEHVPDQRFVNYLTAFMLKRGSIIGLSSETGFINDILWFASKHQLEAQLLEGFLTLYELNVKERLNQIKHLTKRLKVEKELSLDEKRQMLLDIMVLEKTVNKMLTVGND